jgi:hypothetical protein
MTETVGDLNGAGSSVSRVWTWIGFVILAASPLVTVAWIFLLIRMFSLLV